MDGSKWIACRKNFFLSVRVLSRLYRRLILEGLAKLYDAGKLHFFGDHVDLIDKTVFNDFLKPLRQIDLGTSTPKNPSLGRRRCWRTCRVTPTGWQYPTAA